MSQADSPNKKRSKEAQLAALHALQNEEKYLEDSSKCNKLASRICGCLSSCYNKMSCLVCCKNLKWSLFPADCSKINPWKQTPMREMVEIVVLDPSPIDRLVGNLDESITNAENDANLISDSENEIELNDETIVNPIDPREEK